MIFPLVTALVATKVLGGLTNSETANQKDNNLNRCNNILIANIGFHALFKQILNFVVAFGMEQMVLLFIPLKIVVLMLQPNGKSWIEAEHDRNSLHDKWVNGYVVAEGAIFIGKGQGANSNVKHRHSNGVPSKLSAERATGLGHHITQNNLENTEGAEARSHTE